MSAPADDPILKRFRAALDEIYGERLERVVLFGSRARGDAHENSDYDVAVFLRDMADRWQEFDRLADLSTDILGKTGEFIHAIPYRACMHQDLGPADALSVGMFLQTLLLALTERGLGSCVEVSIAGYPEIVRAQLAIPAELSILCGLAVGYPDPDFPANKLHVGREPVGENVVFLDN